MQKHSRNEQKQNVLEVILKFEMNAFTSVQLRICQHAITHLSYGFSASIRHMLSSHKTDSGIT